MFETIHMSRFYSYSVCLCLLLLSISWKASAQAAVVIGEPKASEKYSRESVEKALREGTANLLMMGGVAPVIHRGQEKFKEKYGVGYYDFGEYLECTPREMRVYNEVIFEWLNQQYGKEWQKDVISDVVGLDKWLLYQDAVSYFMVESKPTFNGGSINEFSKWLNAHVVMEEMIEEQLMVSSRVNINILLSEEGEIIDIDNRGLDTAVSSAFIKAIQQAPKWSPGLQNGVPCKVYIPFISIVDFR